MTDKHDIEKSNRLVGAGLGPGYEQKSIAAKDLTDEQLQAINEAKHPVDAYKAKLREQIEGMKDEASDSNYAGFYNQALSDVLKLLEDDNE